MINKNHLMLENLSGRGRRGKGQDEEKGKRKGEKKPVCLRRRKKKEGERTSTLGEIKGGESEGVGTPKVEYVEKGIKKYTNGEKGEGQFQRQEKKKEKKKEKGKGKREGKQRKKKMNIKKGGDDMLSPKTPISEGI